MLGRNEYITNLALTASVTAQGCVIECGVWKGGTSAVNTLPAIRVRLA
jgi:hypothetical protein